MQQQLTETQILLSASLRDLLEREVSWDRLRQLEKEGSADSHLWSLLHRDGWLALPFPETDGGAGGSLVDAAIVAEELARRAAIVPYVETTASLWALGPERGALLREVIGDGSTIAPALFGPDDDPRDAAITVDSEGRLSGVKQAVDYPESTLHLVSAAGNLHLAAADGPGVRIEPVIHVGRTPKARVTYDAAPARRVGDGQALDRLLAVGTAMAAIQCLGAAATALDMTLTYVVSRVQFGRPIATFQAVQHECADMATMIEFTRFLVYEAIAKLDAGTARAEDIAVAKAWASRAATEVTLMAHQLHGGIGVTEEYNLNFFSRRAKERALAWATHTECLRTLAASVDVEEAWV